jgi:hypothetical protein
MLHFPHPPEPDQLETTLWRIDVPYLSPGDEGWYVFATEPQGSAPLKPPRDPVAQAVLIPGNPYRLSERCEKHALRSEVIAVALFLLGTVLNGLILFTALMYLLR